MRFTFIFFFFAQILIAQNISGIILDSETNKPIENVNIYFERLNIGAASDVNGTFSIKNGFKLTKTDYLEFSIIGYHNKELAVKTLTKSNNIIYLSKKLENLGEVIVNSPKSLNSRIHFKTLKPLKTGVSDFGSQVVGDYIYVISGNSSYIEDSGRRALERVSYIAQATLDDLLKEFRSNFSFENYTGRLQIYDIQNNSWSVAKTKFRKRAYHNLDFYENKLYSLGGKRLSINRKKEYLDDKIEVFDIGSETIAVDHTNPHQAVNFASFTYKDNIIVMGGSTSEDTVGKKVYTNESYSYNIISGNWYQLPKMKTAKETQGVIIEDTIYLIGGYNGEKLDSMESYNVKTGIWQTEGTLFYEIERPALTVHGHTIYMFNDGRLMTYDTKTNILEAYKISLNLKHPRMHYHQNKLYLLGGYLLNSYSKKASSSLYTIDLDEFSKTKPVNSKKIVREHS